MRAYDAPLHGAGWIDLSARGRLRITGTDRARLLHAIASNTVETLAPGSGVYAFFLNPQGRIQADSHIFMASDHLVVDCEPESRERLRQHIESYIIMDDVTVTDVGDESAVLGLAGPNASAVARALVPDLPDECCQFVHTSDCTTYRMPLAGIDGYRFSVPTANKKEWIDALERQGAVSVDRADCETLRVRNSVPRFGCDFGPANIPHETGLMSALSFTKGCYTGQEIVERVRSRGQVRRTLVPIELDGTAVPESAAILFDGRIVGALTSPTGGEEPDVKARGFAILRTTAAAPGTPVTVGGLPATVLDRRTDELK